MRHAAARRLVALAAALLLAGCATADPQASFEPAGGKAADGTAAGDGASVENRQILAVDDPLEGMNRRIYKFNAQADRWVLLPIVDAYEFAVPLVFRDRVSDFFSNIGDLTTFANLTLQLKFAAAGKTALRFGTNSLLGMFGLVDIATPMGLPKYQADFGQTLGVWGVDAGPYLILPILGPSSVRDTAGKATDTVAFSVVDPFGAASFQSRYPPVMAADAINARYEQPFRYFESGSPFEYDLVRFLITKKRQAEIGDGLFGSGNSRQGADGDP